LIPGAPAPYRSPYKLTPAEWTEYMRQPEDFEEREWVHKSRSPYTSPVVFVPKPGGEPRELRMCIDYRTLNAITIKDRFPLPFPEELIDKWQGKKVFSKLDLWAGYHHTRVAEEDVEKTAFIGPDVLWEWTVIPFGVATTPAWFMCMMSGVLDEHIRKGYCVVFLDDILIFSDSKEEHDGNVHAIMATLPSHGLRLKGKKSFFGLAEADFLGFTVSGAIIQITEEKIKAITDWPMVRSHRDLRSFLGLARVYRKFAPDFALAAMP
jgi:hypothetical protein